MGHHVCAGIKVLMQSEVWWISHEKIVRMNEVWVGVTIQ